MNPSKVTGNINFNLKHVNGYRKWIDTVNKDNKYKVQLNHKINELTFGNQKGHDKIR